jgi:hypothetical protein
MPLFSEPDVPRTSPLRGTEPRVHWYSESTRPEAVAARTQVNEWYDDFPDPNGKFAKRVRSENDVDHVQAVDELIVHHILRQTNDDVRYEVGDVGPDFRIYEDGKCVGGVEVLSLFERKDW